MSIFEAVKQSVTTRQAAERYGIRVERNGMCRCPFHDDSTPSMKLDRRYYCFGCGATGDVIDFVSRLRGIGSKEAAILLAQGIDEDLKARNQMAWVGAMNNIKSAALEIMRESK